MRFYFDICTLNMTNMEFTVAEENAIYARALMLTPGLGNRSIRQIARFFEDDLQVLRSATKKQLLEIEGVTERLAKAVLDAKKQLPVAESECRSSLRCHSRMVAFNDAEFPHRLRVFDDAPVVVFVKGNALPFHHQKSIGVVGTRNATDAGRGLTTSWIESWQPHQPCIVSGLAYGIDITAHQAALKCDLPTVAVLGNGLDTIYPSLHRSVADHMLEKGGLLSEFPPGTKPDRQNFPIRNRIVAMLSDALVVVEAAKKGGALITANMAFDYNKEVYAVPGRPGDKYSEGCNALIAQNKAALIHAADQLPNELRWDDRPKNTVRQAELFVELNAHEKQLMELLGRTRETPLETLCSTLNQRPSSLLATLLEMELKGLVRSMPGNRFASLM